jgi:hypothetical protein
MSRKMLPMVAGAAPLATPHGELNAASQRMTSARPTLRQVK